MHSSPGKRLRVSTTREQISNTSNDLFANAGVSTPSERDALVAKLNAGTQTRAGALRQVAENPVLFRQINHAFVMMQYFGYLRRNANDPPDQDFSGLNFWLNKLNEFSLPART